MKDAPYVGNYVHSLYDKCYKYVDCIILTSDTNIRYFTEANISEAIFVAARTGAWCYLFVDSRYYEDACREAMNCEVVLRKNIKKQLSECFEKHGVTRIGIEAEHLTVSKFVDLKMNFPKIEILDSNFVSSGIEVMRTNKTDSELNKIHKAQLISEQALDSLIKNDIREGVSERYLAAKYYEYISRFGAEKTAFDTIVLFGSNSSKPHGVPSNRTLKKGTNILIDCGAKYYGYCSDMTRNIFFGTPTDKYLNVYNIVLEAQKRAIEKVAFEARLEDIDAAARDYIKEQGYGDKFGHATGHGVGMDIHEYPSIAPQEPCVHPIIEDRMVVTIEPGIYLPGDFGVRIEDLIAVKKDKVYNLTNFSKELIVL